MRRFYEVFSNEKLTTLLSKLTWSHYLCILSIKNIYEIEYYIYICINQNLSVRQLENKIKLKEYERLSESVKNKLINQEEYNVVDFVKNPIRIKNDDKYDIFSEKVLQKLIVEDIETFLDELGNGFAFIKSEYPIKLADRYNYIDLLLYNIKYKCYVVVELKITELKKEHIGQIEVYMNYIDKNLKTIEEDKTIGIIIVKKEDKYIMEYCSDDRILTKEYILISK